MKKKYVFLAGGILSVVVLLGFVPGFFRSTPAVHIAVVSDLSSPWIRRGVQERLDQQVPKGVVNGRKIVLDVFDDRDDPVEAENKAREIVQQGRALAVLGHRMCACSIAGSAVYKQAKIPALTPTSTHVDVCNDNEWYFQALFNDDQQGRFIAAYAHYILHQSSLTILHDETDYGTYLARRVAETFRAVEGARVATWSFTTIPLEQTLAQLGNATSTGAVFIAALCAPASAQLVAAIRESDPSRTLIFPDDFSDETFLTLLERASSPPGRPATDYTQNCLFCVPFLFDAGSADAQQFRAAYRKAYRAEPDWEAAFAYDACGLLIHALQEAGLEGTPSSLQADREKIRSYLSKLDSPANAVQGITGLTYFNPDRSSSTVAMMARFGPDRSLLPMPIQVLPGLVAGGSGTENVDDTTFLLGDQWMRKVYGCETGVKFNAIESFDVKNGTCALQFDLWFRYPLDMPDDPCDIEFINAAEPLVLPAPIQEKDRNGFRYRLYSIKGTFDMDAFAEAAAFGQHALGFAFQSRNAPASRIRYFSDTLGMDELNTALAGEENALTAPDDWILYRTTLYPSVAKKPSLGDPDLMSSDEASVRSRFNATLLLKPTEFILRRGMSFGWAMWITVGAVLIGLTLKVLAWLLASVRKRQAALFFSDLVLKYLLLISSEVVVMEELRRHTQYTPDSVTQVYSLLWWFLPAHLIVNALRLFLWPLLERSTGRKLPQVVCRFVSFLIYVLAFFGIVAFVFHQPLTSLLATSGMAAMIIGFAVQMNLSNIFSGIAINMEQPFRVGDWIQVGEESKGKVIEVTWRSTRIQTETNDVISLPNTLVAESIVQNYNFPDQSMCVTLEVHIIPVQSPERAAKILCDALYSVQSLTEPTVQLSTITDSAATYTCSYTIADHLQENAIRETVWKAIWRHLKLAAVPLAIEGHEELFAPAEKPDQAILRSVETFKPFSDAAMDYICERLKKLVVCKGEVLVKQGDSGDSLFIITEGAVAITVTLPEGKTLEVSRLGVGSFVGEMALLLGEKRTATITALSTTHLFEITKEIIAPLLEKTPEIAEELAAILARRKAETDAKQKGGQTVEKNESLGQQLLRGIQRFFGIKAS